ncbi:hypothetical protein L6452_10436 [Arctium lappa]|uniref:Uncharacterized protein n=1 Tax=Arctium lappa TaxID=4217 RepID=A0ACB9DMB8_ARCLA|nr:hypothetical protein L6452_10436 [Arctium lappa]
MALFVGVAQIKAATCDPGQLVSCLDPIVNGTPPPSKCCSKLKEQKSCLCRYIKDPNLGRYVKSPGAKKAKSMFSEKFIRPLVV